MSSDKTRDIHDRIYAFALGVLDLTKDIPHTTENIIVLKQVVRSAGSIGANASEADGAESRKEFVHRFTIAKKEAKETSYWLSLLADHNPNLKEKVTPLLTENNQLIAIISKIILNTINNAKV